MRRLQAPINHELGGTTVPRGKEKMPCEQFLQGFEISRAFLCTKKVLKNRVEIHNHNPVKIAHNAVLNGSYKGVIKREATT